MRKGLVFFPDWSRDNPYQKLLYNAISKNNIPCQGCQGNDFTLRWLFSNRMVKFIHLHWLFGIYDPKNNGLTYRKALMFVLKLLLGKMLGYRIFWTVHNFSPHESTHPRLEKWIRKKVSRFADAVIVHCNYAKELIIKHWRTREEIIKVIPHGSYIGYYPNSVSREEARRRLGFNDDHFTFLFFGMIRNYKGINTLIPSFAEIEKINPAIRLIIAGRPYNEAIKGEIETMVENNKNISCFLRYIPDEEVQYFFNASDAVVLPYQNVLTSGGAILALSFGKPVVIRGRGCIPELINDDTGFLYYHSTSLTQTMLRALRNFVGQRHKEKALDAAKELDWNTIVKKNYLPLLGQQYKRETVLIITNHLPQFDRASGCYRLFNMIKGLNRHFNVIVYSEWFHKYYDPQNDMYSNALLDLGVEIFLPHGNESKTKDNLRRIVGTRSLKAVIIEFFHIAEINLDVIRECNPEVPVIIDTVDLHFYRLQMMADTKNDEALKQKAIEIREREVKIYSKADYVWAISRLDKEILLTINPDLKVCIVPNFHPIPEIVPMRDARQTNTLLFIGGFNHPPNVDAVLYFCREILPIVKKKVPDIKVRVVGDSPPPEIEVLQGDTIEVTGYVPETKPYIDSSYISIAPLRFGSGMKGKVGEALASGLPLVTTEVGAQGMGLKHRQDAWIADTPEDFAEGIIKLCMDNKLYDHLSKNGRKLMQEAFSCKLGEETVFKLLNSLSMRKAASPSRSS